MAVTNKYITIKTHIEGSPQNSDFEFKTQDLSLFVKHGSNNVLVKSLYLSVDPYQLNRMKKYSSAHNSAPAIAPLAPGQVIDAFGLGKVVASEHPNFKKDDLVTGMITWAEYCTVKGDSLSKLDSMGLPLSYHVGVLGISGLTAYVGFFDVCKPKKGEKVFVSAASGSVGSVVGQYAKLFGCHVVGCAGSKKKVELLKEKLGFDDAFNYKEETDLKSALKRYFPEGIDIYFDNVGAEMLQAAVANMNHFGRVAACGVISEYPDSAGRRAGPNMVDVVFKRITIQGFIVGDHFNMFPEFVSKTSDYLRTGKMKVVEDISRGLESVPAAFVGLFCGDNTGKKIVQIVDD